MSKKYLLQVIHSANPPKLSELSQLFLASSTFEPELMNC